MRPSRCNATQVSATKALRFDEQVYRPGLHRDRSVWQSVRGAGIASQSSRPC